MYTQWLHFLGITVAENEIFIHKLRSPVIVIMLVDRHLEIDLKCYLTLQVHSFFISTWEIKHMKPLDLEKMKHMAK